MKCNTINAASKALSKPVIEDNDTPHVAPEGPL
jgi:hypothetical protein